MSFSFKDWHFTGDSASFFSISSCSWMLQFQSSPVGLSIEHGKVFRTATYLMYDQTREYGLKIEGHAKGGGAFLF